MHWVNGEDFRVIQIKLNQFLRECPYDHWVTNKAYFSAITVTNISQSFTYKTQRWQWVTLFDPWPTWPLSQLTRDPLTRWPTVISDKTAPKTGWHRYETKLRHCHPMFSPHSDLVKNEGARAAVNFGIDSVENLVTNRRNRFVNRHGETGNYPRQMFCWFVSSVWVYFLRLFNVCLLYLFIVLSCRIRWWNKAVRYDTIRDAILTCARKPTWVSLIYRTETTTKV